MNTDLMLRYFIELLMVIPAAVLAVMPVYYTLKVKKPYFFGLLSVLLLLVISGGTALCTLYGLRSNTVVFPSMIVFFIAYNFCFDLSVPKKIFAFANATLLCAFSTTYTSFIAAPIEIGNPYHVYYVRSGLICLTVSAVVGALFAKTLIVRFPELFENESIDSAWKILIFAPIVTSAAVIWMNPVSAENVMTGRLRMICIVVLLSIPLIALFLYYVLWWFSKKITETINLQRSYDLMKMEEKQYQRTLLYLQETSRQRHDFRQHIHVISEYLKTNDIEKLEEYIAPIVESVDRTQKILSKNRAVDAIANHYDDLAKSQNVVIRWTIRVEETLPVKESDMCAVIGNLIENAVQAAAQLEGDDRQVRVNIGVLQKETLVILVENSYHGTLTLNKDGLPISKNPEHGIGLKSVKNIVEQYSGSMEIETHNQFFKVSILMYEPDK